MILLALSVACSIDDRRISLTGGGLGGAGSGGAGGDGNAGPAALTVVPATIDLGSITQGFAAQARLRLRNDGDTPLAVPAVAWGAGSDPDLKLVQNQCFDDLASGSECELRVQLVPSRAEELRGTLEISSAPAGTVTVPVAARGLVPGDILLVPAAGSFEDFGAVRVGEVAQGAFTVTNPGAASSGPLSFFFNRPEFALAEAGPGGCVSGVTELASGQSCDLAVAFGPQERGAVEAVASVSSIGAGSMSVGLRGQGLVPGVLSVSVTTLDFGGVIPGDAASLSIAVENRGDEPLTLARVAFDPADAGVFTIADSNCGEGMVLAAGETCRVQVAFRPVQEGVAAVGTLLLQTAGGEQSKSVALSGRGLVGGALLVEPVASGEEDFGPVVIGESLERSFRISNPSMQESGAISLQASTGFALLAGSEAGACAPDVTTLLNGDSCTVRVSFSPTTRGPSQGSLTVDSPLAGAKSLTLLGTGIAPALLGTDTGGAEEGVVDFGRVTTGSSGRQTITLSNLGDQPMPAPTLEVIGAADQAAAFGFESGCSEPLGFEQTCEVAVTFAPTAAGPHSANLAIATEPGGRASLLLLGEAREPGRLVLAAEAEGGEDFGDVAIGSNLARSFTLSNPGDVSSGVLTLRTDDSQFVVDAGGCGQLAAGLGSGESCAFQVSFAPTSNELTETRLAVLSPVAGETGIAVKGRGRSPAALQATTTERDLGRANLGEPSGPANEFTWTVNNPGDLPTGALTVASTNTADFDVTADTCSDQEVAGGSSCTVTAVFAPDAVGNRTGVITVADPASAASVTLQLTGFGVRLGELGEGCLVNSDCADGLCSGGVCCNQICNGTCQTCETGQCLPQNAQEPCGNGSGVCFGVNQCQLPAGVACSTDAECGGNLVCKDCRAGGRQCTAPDACCGGCASPFECVGGECACPLQNDGQQQLDCGGGVCAINREGACCTSAPPPGCNCDPTDNLCKECLVASQCPPGATGTTPACVGNQCQYSCNTALGFTSCNGSCIGPGQCCTDQQCPSLCQQCDTTTNTCQTFAPGSSGRCGLGEVCDGLSCISLPGLGDACNGDCSQGTCHNGICCEEACAGGASCDGQGRCPVCFSTVTVHPLAAGECDGLGGEFGYCVPAASADSFPVRAQAACEACTGGPCSQTTCTTFGDPAEAFGFASTAEPRHVWVFQAGICNGRTIEPGQGYFDPIGDVTLTF
jgi:HYDIN/CFA65/VesB family protein